MIKTTAEPIPMPICSHAMVNSVSVVNTYQVKLIKAKR